MNGDATKVKYDEIDLTKPAQEFLDTEVVVVTRNTHIADEVVIIGRAMLTEKIITKRTKFLNNPELIYLKNQVDLVKRNKYKI